MTPGEFDGIKKDEQRKQPTPQAFPLYTQYTIVLGVVLVGVVFLWFVGSFAAVTFRVLSNTSTTTANLSLRQNENLETMAAYWSFDNTTLGSSTATDLSGNTLTGSVRGFEKVTFPAAGSYSYIVPTGATSTNIKAWGAGGGGGLCSATLANACTGGYGGGGGFVRADVTATPAETLTVEVGTAGALTAGAGNGGGYSAVKRSATYLAQAGAGGGGGGSVNAGGGNAGDGGGSTGVAGGNGTGTATVGGGGGAGQSGSGGTAGTAGTSGTAGTAGAANAGGNGGATGTGGAGGTGGGGSGSAVTIRGGGGGGGGRFGGGGGGSAGAGSRGGGGGGGGSDLVTGSNTVETAGSVQCPGNNTDTDHGVSGCSGAGLGGFGQFTDNADHSGDVTATAGADGRVVVRTFGAATSTLVAAVGRLGQGLQFSTTSQTVLLVATTSSTNVVKNASAATVAFWVKDGDFTTAGYQTAVDIGRGATDATPRLRIDLVGTSTTQGVVQLAARAGDTESIQYATTSSAVLTEGTWHHVVVVVDYANDATTMYVDGTSVATTGALSFTATATSNTAPFIVELGRGNGLMATQLGGVLDDVRIFNRALSATDVTRLYHLGATTNINTVGENNTNGLVQHWTFDGGRTNTGFALNSVSGGVTGTLQGTLTSATTTFSTEGSSSYVVPSGSTAIFVKMWGAGGGGGGGNGSVANSGGAGNSAGFASSTLAATGGESLSVYVGGGGGGGKTNAGGGGTAGTNGGAAGGNGVTTGGGGGGGGGYSALLRSATELITAAGGGGGGGGAQNAGAGGALGGVGGGTTGGNGAGNNSSGGGGGQSGSGGTAGSSTGQTTPPTAGSALQGGTGGVPNTNTFGGGGGAGGGHYGGGGASGTVVAGSGGGGAGGGSSFISSGSTNSGVNQTTPGNSTDGDRTGTVGQGGSGGTIANNGSAGSSGKVLIGAVYPLGPTPAIGRIGQGLSFDGTTQYISIGNAGSGIKTIAFWVKATATASKKIIDVNGTQQIETNGSSQVTATSFPAATVYVDGSSASAVITTAWRHVAIVDTTGVNASAVDIGRVASSYFGGTLDDVRMYNTALSAAEVLKLYQAGAPRSIGRLGTPIAGALQEKIMLSHAPEMLAILPEQRRTRVVVKEVEKC